MPPTHNFPVTHDEFFIGFIYGCITGITVTTFLLRNTIRW